MRVEIPRLTVAGLSGDGGKTLVSLGLARALTRRGYSVATFKKGPDYIDPAWLAAASGGPCRNLDTFLMDDAALGRALSAASAADLWLIEGNRGLYDGADADGTHSTAELAKRLGSPVVLVVDCTKVTRTVAAVVLGCRQLDRSLDLAGVILNHIATARQETVIREAVEEICQVPVLGAVPRLRGDDPLPSRHLGLVTAVEHPRREEAIDRAADAVARYVELDRLVAVARTARPAELPARALPAAGQPVSIGYFRDEAFSFYYPENLEGLRAIGAQLTAVAPGADSDLPEIDGLYIGGGFPEVHATRLADNRGFADRLRRAVADGLPVYAECGGLMYLARELRVAGVAHEMSGILDLVVEQTTSPQGHGYEVGTVDHDNPFHPCGVELRGHEFHYSRVVGGADLAHTVVSVDRGTGTGGGRDGVCVGRVWASYLHLHGGATPGWADGFLELARSYRVARLGPAARRAEG